MHTSSMWKSALLSVVLVLVSLAGWEMYLRSEGYKPDYDDGGPLWSDKRKMVYKPMDEATVFIGSSRNKFDINVPTWESLTGEKVIQLAIEGSCPLPVLDNLANDNKFKGKLMIDVTEGLFFSNVSFLMSEPNEDIDYYKKETPAQLASFKVDCMLQSRLVFLDKKNFALHALMRNMNIPDRPYVFEGPHFPPDFARISFDRQCIMTDRFVADTNLQNDVRSTWAYLRTLGMGPALSDHQVDSVMLAVKGAVDKIQARGGKVIFVRTPSSGPFLMGESQGFPREKYWNKLLQVTGCQGIHFADYPATDHFQCPEFSHLKPSDGVIWTTNLVQILQKDKGWVFPHAPAKS